MREVFRKRGNQRARCCQISQRYPFECSARGPRGCCFAGPPRRDSVLSRFAGGSAFFNFRDTRFRTPSERRFIPSIVLSLGILHSAFSGFAISMRQSRRALNFLPNEGCPARELRSEEHTSEL